MSLRALAALIRKDLLIFFTDRYAVILAFAAPIALASFMAAIFGGAGPGTPSKIPIRLVILDRGEVGRAIVARVLEEPTLAAVVASGEEAEASVRKGSAVAAVIIPDGFGARASEAAFGGPDPPELTILGDPTHQSDLSMLRGILTRLILEAVTAGSPEDDRWLAALEADPLPATGPEGEDVARAEFLGLFPGLAPDQADRPDDEARLEFLSAFPGLVDWFDRDPPRPLDAPVARPASGSFKLPFATGEVSITPGPHGERSALAGHAFASMVVQFVLFSAIEWGIGLILERQRGIWKRLRAAPLARSTLLMSKAMGSGIVSLTITLAVFGFGALAFGFRVQGDPLAFVLVAVAYAMTASTFGLLVAAAGRTPQAARSIAILVVLVLVLLGGGWIPGFLFPRWLDALTVAVPTRWAIDGFDGVLSRGYTLRETLPTLGALAGFAAAFGLAALSWRPRRPMPVRESP